MAPKSNAEVLSRVPEHHQVVICLTEKTHVCVENVMHSETCTKRYIYYMYTKVYKVTKSIQKIHVIPVLQRKEIHMRRHELQCCWTGVQY